MRQIRGKRALVTGAASGIGRAIALRLASEGCDVAALDIDQLGLAETVTACRAADGDVHGLQYDVSQPREISAAVEDLLGRWGGVDILVNNAGITYYGRLHNMVDEHWDRVLQINLHAHVQFTRELLPTMLAQPEAHVVNLCSVFGLVAMPKLNAYCVSKYGLVGFSEALRAEYGREGLGVTAMCPGFVDTNLFTNGPTEADRGEHKVPPRWLRTTAEKVAHATVKAIRRDKRLVVVEPFARSMYAVKRFAPALMDTLLHLGRGRRIRKKLAEMETTPQEMPATVRMPERQEPTPRRRAA